MALGRITRIPNLNQKFGSHTDYLITKVQADYSSSAEEYLLFTDHELDVGRKRGELNPEDYSHYRAGVLTVVQNTNQHFGSADAYFGVNLISQGSSERVHYLFTVEDLEKARVRAERNPEDIEANKTSWFADLFD